MVFGLATWLSKQKGGSKTKFPVVLLTQSPGERLLGEKYWKTPGWVGPSTEQSPFWGV